MGSLRCLALLCCALLLSSCATTCTQSHRPGAGTARAGDNPAVFKRTNFSRLKHWQQDDHYAALMTFLVSCERIEMLAPNANIAKKTAIGGKAADWQPACRAAKKVKTSRQAKAFFEAYFYPYAVYSKAGNDIGKFSGYYEIELEGSLRKRSDYPHPVYGPPKNLHNLKRSPSLARRAIDKGSLKNRGLEVAWVKSKPRLFFMQIQGSGVLKLPDGQHAKLGYAGQNGYPYTSIGPYFKLFGATGIRSPIDMIKWLERHPKVASKIMDINQSYIFFQRILGSEPMGAQGTALTPERSMAIDHRVFPYGTPIWVETGLPHIVEGKMKGASPYHRLFIAQDCGGAIKGAVRGDIFFGRGHRAEILAAYLNKPGRYFALFPKTVVIEED